MNRGLLLKALREAWVTTLLFGVGLFVFEALLAYLLPRFFADSIVGNPLFRTVVQGILGTEVPVAMGPLALHALAWVHPVALALLWGHEILLCTRMPAKEIDQGTIDSVLALPVSRWSAYLTETAVWLGTGALLVSMAYCGALTGGALAGASSTLDAGRLTSVVVNFFCLYLAVGGLAFLVSSCSDRRGRAIGLVFGIVVASVVLNFLTQFWEVARRLSFLGLLEYYRPIVTLQSGGWPLGDIAVLVLVGSSLWIAGAIVFNRRDISTV